MKMKCSPQSTLIGDSIESDGHTNGEADGFLRYHREDYGARESLRSFLGQRSRDRSALICLPEQSRVGEA